MIKLKPVKDKYSYHQAIYQEIKRLLDNLIFKPILAIAKENGLENAANTALTAALRKGEVTYAQGYFTGKFNSKLGLELRAIGATWNKLRRAYYLPENKVGTHIKIAAASGLSIIKDKVAKINKRLDAIQKSNVVPEIRFNDQFSGILLDIDKQFKTTMPGDINIPMTLTPFMRETIERDYTKNINTYIQDMAVKSCQRLREKVQENVSQGYRASNLVDLIQAQRGVSDRHALFIAKQETQLMTSTYRDSRYREANITEWVWSSSHDSRVRPLHRKLDGRKFNYTNKLPVIDETTGEKGVPGQAYGCRCTLIPLLDTDKYVKLGINKDKSVEFEIR